MRFGLVAFKKKIRTKPMWFGLRRLVEFFKSFCFQHLSNVKKVKHNIFSPIFKMTISYLSAPNEN